MKERGQNQIAVAATLNPDFRGVASEASVAAHSIANRFVERIDTSPPIIADAFEYLFALQKVASSCRIKGTVSELLAPLKPSKYKGSSVVSSHR